MTAGLVGSAVRSTVVQGSGGAHARLELPPGNDAAAAGFTSPSPAQLTAPSISTPMAGWKTHCHSDSHVSSSACRGGRGGLNIWQA